MIVLLENERERVKNMGKYLKFCIFNEIILVSETTESHKKELSL